MTITRLNPAGRGANFLRLALLSIALAVSARTGSAAEPILRVASAGTTLMFTQEEFQLLPHTTIAAFDSHTKMQHLYSGVPVKDLLIRAGAPLGEHMRGQALGLAVMVHANDGYSTLYALAEFDDAFSDRVIFLADAEDGKPLVAGAGPLRIVAPGDKRAARWARMVKSIEVVSLPDASAHP